MPWILPVVPSVPVGNPFTALRDSLDIYTYSRPTPGLNIRLGVLFGLTGLGLLGSVVLFGLVWTDQRRRKGSSVWFFRLVQRENGRHIVSNVKFITPITSSLMLIAILGYLVNAYGVHVRHGPQSHIGSWRSVIALPMVAGGWTVTWGTLQAYLLTPNSVRVRCLTPLVMNVCYLGVGTLLIVGLAVAIGFDGAAYSKAYEQYVLVDSVLHVRELAWEVGDNFEAALASLLPDIARFNKAYTRVNITAAATFAMLSMIAFLLFFINIGSLALLFTVRRQISLKLSDLAKHVWLTTAAEPDQSDESDPTTTGTSGGHRRTLGSVLELGSANPSRGRIRKLARLDGTPRSESARQLVGLQIAERDLLLIAWTLAQLGGGGGAVCLLVTVLTARDQFFNSSWPMLEVCYFSAPWTFTATILLFTVFRIHNTYVNLPSLDDPSSTINLAPTFSHSPSARDPNIDLSFGAFLGYRGAISDESRDGDGKPEEADGYEKAKPVDLVALGRPGLPSLP